MTTVFEEPPNLSVVGWGSPVIRGARVRIDSYVDKEDDPLARWFDFSDDSLDAPLTWQAYCDWITDRDYHPQLFIPRPL